MKFTPPTFLKSNEDGISSSGISEASLYYYLISERVFKAVSSFYF
jgi:hypothetical protein